MDLSLERDGTALGSLFQQIIADMKNTSPLWEDFLTKASKLHACLRAAIQAIATYLDAFQKIADAATNSKGASKEIGTALTRVCLRHKAVETRLKTFTSAIMDCLVLPLQDKLEDWKRQVAAIDKEHAKEYKRCRTELKKRSSDTLRLQKKARKGQSDTIQSLVDSHMHDVTLRRVELEEVEKKSLRSAMVEERMRYCTFVHMLQPVVKEECEVMSELGHLQEAMQSIAIVTKDPNVLPQSSEELILDAKSTINIYPESPGGTSSSMGACSNSLGSRKSSVCSISSMNSSGSSGSPGHHHYPRSLSQLISPTIRLKPGESSDSGFCSSPALTSQASTATSQSHVVSTWPPHSQEIIPNTERPHTISSAYEKGHQRPSLTVYTYQNPETIMETTSQKSPANIANRPPLPVRCSSLERPLSVTNRNNNSNILPRQCPSPIPVHITKELAQHQQQPTYVNMSELATMAAIKNNNQQLVSNQALVKKPSQSSSQQQLQHQQSTDSHSSVSSAESSVGGKHNHPRSKTPSLQSHPSTDSTTTVGSNVATPTLGHNVTPSSGSSTPQNNFPINNTNNSLMNYDESKKIKESFSTSLVSSDDPQRDEILKITETENNIISSSSNASTLTTTSSSINSISNNHDSVSSTTTVDKEEISRGSVLAKTSMFEKQAAANNNPPLSSGRSSHSISSGDSIYSIRKEEITGCKITSDVLNDKDSVDKIYEDSIQELNNLIGELDSFQREHEINTRGNNQTKNNYFQVASNITNGNKISTPVNDADGDKISIGSLNFSTHSTNISDVKFGYSDSEISRYVSETSSIGGFENPSFAHFNQTDDSNFTNQTIEDNDSESVVMVYDQILPIADIDYLKQNSEIVILRCKDPQTLESSNSSNITTDLHSPKQRLSSFRSEQLSSTVQQSDNNNSKDITSVIEPQLLLPPALPPRPSIKNTPSPSNIKNGCLTRIARRSSVNSAKPPPPVRRSSSVTPSHNVSTPNSPNLIQQNAANNSAESLPPPPAYLLDQQTNHPSPASLKVSETVKALSAIRHTPASPSAIRRAQNAITHQQQHSATIQNKNQSTNIYSPSNYNMHEVPAFVSIYNQTPSQTHQQQPNTLLQPNISINNEHNQHKQQTPQVQTTTPLSIAVNNLNNHNMSCSNSPIENSNQNRSSFRTNNSNSPGIYAQPKQVTSMSSFRSSSPGHNTSNSHSFITPIPQHPQQQHNNPMVAQPKNNPNLIAQLNARLNKQQPLSTSANPNIYQENQNSRNTIYGSSPNSPHHQNQDYNQENEQFHNRGNERASYYYQHQQITPPSVGRQQNQYDDYSPTNIDKSGSNRSKSKAEFLENLNAKLAKQGISGRAFAVRSLINSKALQYKKLNKSQKPNEGREEPDPRICHESLMDQIKRGATLKRNKKTNDRSAPKIH